MFAIMRKRPVATLAVVTAMLAAAAPAYAGIAIGNPPGQADATVVAPQILSGDHNI
jgi:hypothetical protein